MPDPISTDDLYGPSNPPTPEGAQEKTDEGLPIEETPEIIAEPPKEEVNIPTPEKPFEHQPPPVTTMHKRSPWTAVGALILFIGLFGLGIWLSGFVRQYFPGGFSTDTQTSNVTDTSSVPTVIPTQKDPFENWKTYQVTSGTTKLPIENISFKLPEDVLSPICDSTTCLSQGTYLPGGTRFTIAPRGQGQLLTDFRGSAISDVGGTLFNTTETTVAGHPASLFTGNFSGRTVAGYGFSNMRGYMIEVTPTLSLEINHFVPTGVNADFAQDDALFDQIVTTLVLPEVATTPVVTPIITPVTSTIFESSSPARAQ